MWGDIVAHSGAVKTSSGIYGGAGLGGRRGGSAKTECSGVCREVDQILRDRLFARADSHDKFLSLLEEMADSLPAGIAYLTPDLTYCFVNEQLAEINGLPAEFHLGRTVGVIVPDLAPEAELAMRRVLAGGKPLLGFTLTGETAKEPAAHKWEESYYPVIFGETVVGLLAVVNEVR